jgi:S1-C subfamily serine protease
MVRTVKSVVPWIIVCCAAMAAAGTDARPGWLGFGFRYHQSDDGRGGRTGWLLVEKVTDGGPAGEAGLRVAT